MTARPSLGLALAVAVAACDAPAEPETLHLRALGDAGVYEFELEGEDLQEGTNDVVIRVFRDDGPVEDVVVIARTVMPSMGHPTSVVETSADSSGAYEASVVFSMPGVWDFEIETDTDPPDSVVFRVEVE